MTCATNPSYEKTYQELEKNGYRVIGEKFLGYSNPHSPLDCIAIKEKEFILHHFSLLR